uniref:UDENN domain-containing protein n=1 Tax=Gongylonema pulchrum TaxID=637853 RepID=A0A183D841_9BILA
LSPSSGASDTVSLCISDQDTESDKLSIVSEADSGVVVFGKNSRPSSLIGSAALHSSPSISLGSNRAPPILTPSTSGCIVICKVCYKPTVFPDEQTVVLMPLNTALVNVINRYLSGNVSTRDKSAGSSEQIYNCQVGLFAFCIFLHHECNENTSRRGHLRVAICPSLLPHDPTQALQKLENRGTLD